MKKISTLFLFLTALFFVNSKAQNVGIGITTPTDAKLHVTSTGSTTQGLFTNGQAGLSIITESTRPEIGFNMLYKSGHKYINDGYGSLVYYTPSDGKLSFYSSNASGLTGGAVGFTSPILSILPSSNVGIGSTDPEAKLEVFGSSSNSQILAATTNNVPGISMFHPSNSPTLGFNVKMRANSYRVIGNGYGMMMQYSAATGRLSFFNTSTNEQADSSTGFGGSFAVLDSNGYMGLGTSNPQAKLHVTSNVVIGGSSITPATGYILSVDGKIICEELKVQLNAAWPDYVFENDYDLPSLELLEKRVMAQKHLPNIPSAADVKAQKGISLGDMQSRMLEKMEEMYRYMFQMNNENKALKAKVEKLEKLVSASN